MVSYRVFTHTQAKVIAHSNQAYIGLISIGDYYIETLFKTVQGTGLMATVVLQFYRHVSLQEETFESGGLDPCEQTVIDCTTQSIAFTYQSFGKARHEPYPLPLQVSKYPSSHPGQPHASDLAHSIQCVETPHGPFV